MHFLHTGPLENLDFFSKLKFNNSSYLDTYFRNNKEIIFEKKTGLIFKFLKKHLQIAKKTF